MMSFMYVICVCLVILVGILFLLVMVVNGMLFYVMYKDFLCCFCKLILVFIVVLVVNDLLIGFVISGFYICNEIFCEIYVDEMMICMSFESIIGLFVINNGMFFVMSLFVECLIVVVLLFYYCVMVSGRKILVCVVCVVVYFVVFCLF